MKKILFYISIPIIFLAAWSVIPFAQAQDIVDISLTADVDTGCQWSGTPWASNLTVPDGEVCHVYGTGRTAVDIDVATDAGLGGGLLIVGADGTNTDFVASGTITISGTAQIGYPGNPSYDAYMETGSGSGESIYINNGGLLEVIENTSGDNYIASDSDIFVGASGSSGELAIYDDSTLGSAPYITIYDTFNNYAGKTTVNQTLWMYQTGHLNNDAQVQVDGQLRMYDSSTIDNSGTMTNAIVYEGIDSGDSPSITNSGTFEITNASYYLTMTYEATFTNTGTVELANLMNIGSSSGLHECVFTNSSSGTVSAGGLYMYSNVTFNNNDTADVDISGITYVYAQQGTSPNYTDRSTIDNNSTFTTAYLYMGSIGTYYGGILNNSGTFQVSNAGSSSTRVYEGGKITNEAGGVFDPAGGIEIRGGNTTDAHSSANNESSVANAFIVEGTITLYAYSLLSNSGDMTANNGAPLSIMDNDTDIVNSAGTMNLEGSLGFSYDVLVDNDGTINVDGSVIVADSAGHTATIDNGSSAVFSLVATSSNDLEIYNGGSVYNYGVFNVPDDVRLVNTANITNDGASAIFTLTGASGNSMLEMDDTSTFNNNADAQLDVANTSNGRLYVYENSSFVNQGAVDTRYLYVGYDGGTQGGTFTNDGANGTVDVTYTSSNAMHVYRGAVVNTSTYGYNAGGEGASFDINGQITIRGTSGDTSSFRNEGVVEHNQSLSVKEYGLLDLDDGRWVAPGSAYYYLDDDNAGDNAQLEIASGAIYSVFFTYVGASTADNNGDITNYGAIQRVDLDGTPLTTQSVYFYVYNDSIIDNYGDIDTYNGETVMYDSTQINNYSTGTYDLPGSYINVYEDAEFHNYGDVDGYGLRVGYQGNDGGIFYNYYNSGLGVNATFSSTVYIHNDGLFENLPDAEVSFAAMNIGYGSGTTSTYTQYERTTNSNTKTTVSGTIGVNNYGTVDIYDSLSGSNLTIGSGGSAYYTQQAGVTPSNSSATFGGSLTINGSLTIDEGTSLSDTGVAFVSTGGEILNNGTYTGTVGSGRNIELSNDGVYRSGTNSYLDLAYNPGMISGGTSTAEIAGTTNSGIVFEHNAGDLCLGQWDTWPSPTDCVDSTNNLTIGAIDANGGTVEVASDLTVQGGDINLSSGSDLTQDSTSHLQITNSHNLIVTGSGSSTTSNGELDIQGSSEGNHGYLRVDNAATVDLNYISANYDIGSIIMQAAWDPNGDTSLNLASGATLNLNDYEICASSDECAISMNLNTQTDQSFFDISGTVNISSASASDRYVYLGYNSTTYGTAEIDINSGGSLTNSTAGEFVIDRSGKLKVVDDSNTDVDVDLAGPLKINGEISDGTGDRGAYIGGQLECDTLLHVQSNGWLDVGSNGKVEVTGSDTTVDGFIELDGTLDAGNLTVNSGGQISSGDGDPDTTGTGTSTNFYIIAEDVTVNSGGKIASDEVSEVDPGSAGSGSYGGEGEGRSGGGNTYGASKLDETNAPAYGEAGVTDAIGTIDVYGGGGVRIYATGSVANNGEISADGEDSSNTSGGSGAGGTVIIVQDPATTSETFTGTGEITANGGSSSTTGVPVGGGGRIVIESPLLDDPDFSSYGFSGGTISAFGGTNSTDSDYAAAGTIVYLGDANNDDPADTVYGTAIVDQNDNAPTSSEETEIPNSGDIEFARVEARNAAVITYATNPTNPPISCYDNDNGSSVTGPTCTANPDKPDTMYINDTIEGAQSSAEPSVGSPITGLYDLTPAFSVIYRNPEDTASSVDQVIIQVDNEATFSSPYLWDTSSTPITLNTAVTDGQRTEDIEYAGSALSTGTTYYVRMSFEDTTDTNQGLWTHMDIGDHYNFQIDGSMTITDGCSSTLSIYDDYPDGDGGNVRDVDDDRYGNGSCDITVNSTYGYWSVLFGKQSGETAFDDTTATYDIDEIDNAGADCSIHTHGTGTEEEYGYNISSSSTLINNHIETDSECSADYDNWSQTGSDDSYVFDVENNGSEDEIIRVDDNNTATDEVFTLNMHSHVNSSTEVTDYALGVSAIVTTNP